MATFYNSTAKDLDTGSLKLVTSTIDSTVILSILASNTSASASDITATIKDSSNATINTFSSAITIPASSNVELLGNKMVLLSGQSLNFNTSTSGSVDVVISFVEV